MAKRGRPRKNKVQVEEEYYSLSPETKKAIFIVVLFALAVISSLSFLDLAGSAGQLISMALAIAFGLTKYLFPIILICLAYVLTQPSKYAPTWINYLGILIFILSFNGLIHLIVTRNILDTATDYAFAGLGGGLSGLALSYPLNQGLGFWASVVLLLAFTIISILLIFNTTLETLLDRTKLSNIGSFVSNPLKRNSGDDDDFDEEDDDDDEEESETNETEEIELEEDENEGLETIGQPIKTSGIFKKTPTAVENKFAESKFRNLQYDLPLGLLNGKSTKPKSGDVNLAMERIESTLHNFGIDIEMGEVNVGPTVTQYSFKPAEGIKLSRITTLNNDLALALAAHPIRIEAPIPGKSLVGIEVPNHQPALVPLRPIIDNKDFQEQKSKLSLGLGKDVSGKNWHCDLGKMPHLLVAGATGSGKSVCLNTIILSLVYQNSPETLRLILVDPKRVEFTVYNGIPHLLTPVITDVTKTINALRWAIHEMDQRFDILSKAGKRNIESYNEHSQVKMPYIVIVIDELADLMTAASAEVEGSIIRLTQMARAIGIHLVVATQRPSVDIITGLIKANIPGRIAFSVASSMDSRTILDSIGAEKLIGKGDMLFQTAELSKPRRLQGAFVSDREIKNVVNFLKQLAGEPEYDESIVEKQSNKSSFDFGGDEADDELFDEAKSVVLQAGKASASLLQRRLRIGYARAARLIDILEEKGIVGAADGARPRQILMSEEDFDQPTPSVFRGRDQKQDDKINIADDETDLDEEKDDDEDNEINQLDYTDDEDKNQ